MNGELTRGTAVVDFDNECEVTNFFCVDKGKSVGIYELSAIVIRAMSYLSGSCGSQERNMDVSSSHARHVGRLLARRDEVSCMTWVSMTA